MYLNLFKTVDINVILPIGHRLFFSYFYVVPQIGQWLWTDNFHVIPLASLLQIFLIYYKLKWFFCQATNTALDCERVCLKTLRRHQTLSLAHDYFFMDYILIFDSRKETICVVSAAFLLLYKYDKLITAIKTVSEQ